MYTTIYFKIPRNILKKWENKITEKREYSRYTSF